MTVSYLWKIHLNIGARGSAVGWGTALQVGRSWVRFPMVSWNFFIDIILPVALWPWGRLDRNGYQEYFLGGKGDRCVGLTTLPPSCADCLEILEPQPPGTLWACPGLEWDCFTFTFTLNSTKTAVMKLEVQVQVIHWTQKPVPLVPRLRMTRPVSSSLYMPPGMHKVNFTFIVGGPQNFVW